MPSQSSQPQSVKSSVKQSQNSRLIHTPPALSEQSLLALEAADAGTWRWDITTNEISWDARCKALFGLPDSSPNISYEEFFCHLHPDDRESTKDALQHVLGVKGDYDIVHRAIWLDGSVHWLRCKGRILDLLPPQLVGLAIDVKWAKDRAEQYSQIENELRSKSEELEERVRERAAELERRTAQAVELERLLDLSNDAVLVRTVDEQISYWNAGAERLYGWTKKEALGRSPHDLLYTEFPIALAEILSGDHWEGELQHIRRDGTRITVASRWTTLRDKEGRPTVYLEINTDISMRRKAEEQAKQLTARILTLQDEERRKIARELHDCLGQYLASLKMNLDLISGTDAERPAGRTKAECLSDSLEIVERCLTETRTISHLMHPPLLDEVGLGSALNWYVEGFVKRSGIKTNLLLPPRVPRLGNEAEIALFRCVQEGLTNAHRHASCSSVEITLSVDADYVTLTVRDNGQGIPEGRLASIQDNSAQVGIGLAGIRERVRDLGGTFDLSSDSSGTVVTVLIPARIAVSRTSLRA